MWANVSQSEDLLLTVKNERGKEISNKPVSWYATFAIVLDNQEGRRIISLSASEEVIKISVE
jgi:hypothetical protein